MPEKTTRTALTCFVAIVMVVGFTAAPVAAVDDGLTTEDEVTVGDGDQGVTVEEDGVEINTGDDDTDDAVDDLDADDDDSQGDSSDAPANLSDVPVPEEVCTDAGDTIQEEVPVEEVPWLSDLPEEAQPPNVPAELVTPRTVVAIVAGVTPNQCEIQDPNDPSYDPLADGVDPDATVNPGLRYYKDGIWVIADYEATLQQSASGPSLSGMIWTRSSSENSGIAPRVTINDGAKDYTINPTVGYKADGTAHADIEAWAINRRAGTGVDCDGEECQPDASGVPATDAPAIPAPTGQDAGGDDDSDDSDDSGSSNDGNDGSSDSSDSTDSDDTTDTQTSAGGAGTAGGSGGQAAESDDGTDGSSDDADTANDAEKDTSNESNGDDADANDDTDDSSNTESDDDEYESEPADEPVRSAAETDGDGPGFGIGLAVLSVLFATLMARRRLS